VARIDNIVVSRCQGVAPCECSRGPGLQSNYGAGFGCGVGSTIAHNVVGRDVVDGAVVARYSYTVADLAAVDRDKDGVCRGRGGEEKGGGKSHDECCTRWVGELVSWIELK
jgi:hypothetical protein